VVGINMGALLKDDPAKRRVPFVSAQWVTFEERNVADDAEAREELIRRTGHMAVPVTVIGDEVVVGFDRPRLRLPRP